MRSYILDNGWAQPFTVEEINAECDRRAARTPKELAEAYRAESDIKGY